MKRRAVLVVVVALVFGLLGAVEPAAHGEGVGVGTGSAGAAVSKSLNRGGGGNISGAGDRLGSLLSGWAVPVLTVMAGCLLLGALASRNIGASVGIVVISLLGLIFLLAPQSIETFAKGIASTVF